MTAVRVLGVVVVDGLATTLSKIAAEVGASVAYVGSVEEATRTFEGQVAHLTVLGPTIKAPIQVGQRLRSMVNVTSLVLVCPPDDLDRVREAVLITPFLGGDVTCLPACDDDRLLHGLRQAMHATQRRAASQAMLAFAQASLGSTPDPGRLRRWVVLDRLLASAPIGVAVIHVRHGILAWNAAAERITGMAERDLLGTTLAVGLSIPNAEVNALIEHPPPEPPRAIALVRDRALRGAHAIEITVSALEEDADGATRLVLIQDVSDRVAAQTELERTLYELEERVAARTAELSQANERLRAEVREHQQTEAELRRIAYDLKRSNEDLERFAYVASHDLQEPLRMVASYVELLERRYGDKLDKNASEYIAYAVEGAKRLQKLIRDLLDYARVTTRPATRVPVNVAAVVESALRDLGTTLEEVRGGVEVGELPTVAGDAAQLHRVFVNLIANAVRYRSEQPLRIRIDAERDGDHWRLLVSDNGIGIDPHFHARIFTIFRRLDPQRSESGTGLGLAICKAIVERHGGRIWVESTEGNGARFVFTLSDVHANAPRTASAAGDER